MSEQFFFGPSALRPLPFVNSFRRFDLSPAVAFLPFACSVNTPKQYFKTVLTAVIVIRRVRFGNAVYNNVICQNRKIIVPLVNAPRSISEVDIALQYNIWVCMQVTSTLYSAVEKYQFRGVE